MLFCHSGVLLFTMTDFTLDPVNTDAMFKFVSNILHSDRNLYTSTINRRSAPLFGLKPNLLVLLWYSLEGLMPKTANLHHLLRASSFLKLYKVKEVRYSRFQIDKKASRKSTKIVVDAMNQLNSLFILTYFKLIGVTN